MANLTSLIVLFLVACALVVASPATSELESKSPLKGAAQEQKFEASKGKEQLPPATIYISHPQNTQQWRLNTYVSVYWGYYNFPPNTVCETVGNNYQGRPPIVFPTVPCRQATVSTVLQYPSVWQGAYNLVIRAKNRQGYLIAESQPVFVEII